MTLRTAIVMLLLSGTFPLVAQNKMNNPFENSHKYTSFGFMASIPVAKFSSTNLDNGGFAGTGWGIYLDTKNQLINGLHLVSHSTYSWVPMDSKKMEKSFGDYLGLKTEIEGGKHRPFLTTFGLQYDFTLAPFLSIGINAQAGFMYNSIRGFNMTVYQADNTTVAYTDNFKYDTEFSFAYVFGAQLNFQLIEDFVYFQVYADYSGSSYKSHIRSWQIPSIPTTLNIQLVNVGGGFIFQTK